MIYNIKWLLQECILAIQHQTNTVEQILVIDNASTDNSYSAVKNNPAIDFNKIDYQILESNIGGAGGFYEGMNRFLETDCDYIWVMDDDTIPHPDTLEKFIDSVAVIQEDFSFLASTVYGNNKECINAPSMDSKPDKDGFLSWYRYLDKGIVKIESATFVSLLIKKEAVLKCGLPCRDFFIWGDDLEYTKRLTKYYGSAFFVGKSKVLHKRTILKSLDLNVETDKKG